MYARRRYGHVVVFRWWGEATPGEPTAVFAAVAEAWDQARRPVLYVGLHGPDSQEPGWAVQREGIKGFDRGMRRCRAAYLVLEGGDALTPLQCAFYEAMQLAARVLGMRSRILRLARSLDEVLGAEAADLPMTAPELRRRLREDGMLREE